MKVRRKKPHKAQAAKLINDHKSKAVTSTRNSWLLYIVKDPNDWKTRPTGAQRSYLKRYLDEAVSNLTKTPSKADASKRIDELPGNKPDVVQVTITINKDHKCQTQTR